MTLTQPITLPFSNIRASDLPLVGGKGANLGEMTHAGFPIPTGFCVTTAAFTQFIDGCPQADYLYKQLETVSADVEAARRVGERVRDTLLTVPIPTTVAEAVHNAWQTAGTDAAYAVRSSATAEDLPDASFAGQQDTYLNIIGEEALLDAGPKCEGDDEDLVGLLHVQGGGDHQLEAAQLLSYHRRPQRHRAGDSS